ncbi:mechanosensitive ion channel family protein [Synechococcus sp. CS-1329]|uniref:mechanosensitive ion channel family protein n=1 Tax=Synechococcus sp. CS-1329 TaxID=2847975 RepID=UPI00223BD2F0|nr:mechanosensitive ion channel family protein [Synechococcus sp. CS-1329]MCT0219826.1 mechanosensitive ion channel family protein [Synechococcus sp. CS-1329]
MPVVLLVLTCTLVMLSPAVQAQIPLASSESSGSAARAKPWWDFAQAERCGRLWCSQVLLPYITLGEDNRKFVVAVAADPDAADSDWARMVEQRSETIVESFNAVLSQLRRAEGGFGSSKQRDGTAASFQGKHSLRFWLITTPKPLHPLNPGLDIGTLNNATVVFVLANEKLEISQQILATVTDTDAQHAGLSKEDLAAQWKRDFQSSFNTAVWGLEFNRTFPLARLFLAMAILGISFATAFLIAKLRRFFSQWLRAIQARINALDDQAKRAAMASSDFPDQGPPAPQSPDPAEAEPQLEGAAGIREQRAKLWSRLWHRKTLGKGIPLAFNSLVRGKDQLSQQISRLEIDQRILLRQGQSGLRVLVEVLQLARFSVIIGGIFILGLINPDWRIFALALAQQAVLIPIIWIGVALSELLIDLSIDRSLNQWVNTALVKGTASNRYQLRATTYARVLKGIGRLLCIVTGLYITMMALGVDPSLLAGAGLVAVAIGFLSRDLLEDMINGILILATDRFAIGDVINVDVSSGFVENMNLAATQLRSADGELITIPNREIRTVANLSKDWSRVNFEVDVSASADLRHVLEVVEAVADQLYADPAWKELILQPIEILGFDRIEHSGSQLRVWIMTKPLKQWLVGREFRLRIKQAFDAHGIELGMPHRRIDMVHGSPGTG